MSDSLLLPLFSGSTELIPDWCSAKLISGISATQGHGGGTQEVWHFIAFFA